MGSRVINPPVNIRILHPDASYTSVETVYTGTDAEGFAHWHSIRALRLQPGDRPVWDEMPKKTKVHFYTKERA
jgi:hypothetical protein